MSGLPTLVEPLSGAHRAARKKFTCGVEPLDRYIRERAGQDAKAKVAVTYVLTEETRQVIFGYYTLSALGIRLCDLPEAVQKKLPRYPVVPASLLGRLAVDESYRGRGLGEFLLMDALRRSLESSHVVASMAVVVDAKDRQACAFYQSYDFIAFPGQPHRLFLPMSTVARLFA